MLAKKNIILLIGNGFDLAHGLKTSYSDFAELHLIPLIAKKMISFTESEFKGIIEPFVVGFPNHLYKKRLDYNFKRDYNIRHNYSDEFSSIIFVKDMILKIVDGKEKEILVYLIENIDKIKIILGNQFLGKLFSNDYENWFDIESAYFQELLIVNEQEQNFKKRGTPIKYSITDLNKEFEWLKNELKNYLKTIQIKKNKKIEDFLKRVVFKKEHMVYAVSFNYTATIEQYLDYHYSMFALNHIHGDLEKGKIIFGYGNDKHEDYQEIKRFGNNKYLKYFKTFEYKMNNKYDDLYTKSINGFRHYEVMVLGHSLGLSDKTLLEDMFNSESCSKVHLFLRGDLKNEKNMLEKEYLELLYSASRIFEKDKDLRNKVVCYEESKFFP